MGIDWPFNRIQDDQIVPEQGVIVLGPQGPLHHWQPATDATQQTIIGMEQAYEFGSWQRMPAPIAILGCGTSAASTSEIVITVDDNEAASLAEIILHQTSHLVALTRQRGKHHPRCPLGPDTNALLPEWLVRCIAAAANQLPGGAPERTAVAAGLHLLYDDLDGSHSLSQTIEGRGKNQNGDYWHAIMHRREPDYGNAKYWFRRVGPHPVLTKLPAVLEHIESCYPSDTLSQWSTRLVKSGQWDPFAMVDACESACGPQADPQFRRALEEVQHFEMLHLLVQSCQDAGFSPPTAAASAV